MTPNTDLGMLEMFRSEVETHMAVLNEGLLALEKNPDQAEWFEALMRAAHSIKGAAKIVGVPAAVEVAHAIEDCFVAARGGRIAMTSDLVDVLLEGVDVLGCAAELDDLGRSRVDTDDPRTRKSRSRISEAMRQGAKPGAGAHPAAPDDAESARHGVSHIVKAPDRLDSDWIAAHGDTMIAHLEGDSSVLRLNLEDVTQLDAATLGFLCLAAQPSAGTGAPKLMFESARPEILRLLRSVGLGELCSTAQAKH